MDFHQHAHIMRFKARTLKYVYTVVFIVLSGLGATGSDYAQDFQKNSKYISIQSFLLIFFLYFLVAALHIYIFIFFNSRIRFFPTLHSSPFRYVFSNMLIIIRKCTYTHTHPDTRHYNSSYRKMNIHILWCDSNQRHSLAHILPITVQQRQYYLCVLCSILWATTTKKTHCVHTCTAAQCSPFLFKALVPLMMRLLSSLALLVAKTWKTWGNSIYHNQPLPSGSNSIQVVVATAPALRQLSSLLLLLLLLLVFFFYSFTSYALCVHGFVLLFTTLQIHVYNRIHIQSGHGPHVEHGWARTHWGLFAAWHCHCDGKA